jgi:hypothetical protein
LKRRRARSKFRGSFSGHPVGSSASLSNASRDWRMIWNGDAHERARGKSRVAPSREAQGQRVDCEVPSGRGPLTRSAPETLSGFQSGAVTPVNFVPGCTRADSWESLKAASRFQSLTMPRLSRRTFGERMEPGATFRARRRVRSLSANWLPEVTFTFSNRNGMPSPSWM